MLRLTNGIIAVEVDGQGRLTRLENLKSLSGNVIARPQSIFRAVLHNGENWEDVAYSADAAIELAGGGARGEVRVSKLATRMGVSDVRITLTLSLEGEKCVFGARIENDSDCTLTDFYYPCVGAVRSLGAGEPSLLAPQFYGHLYTRIGTMLSNLQSWDGQNELVMPYPFTASMQWMTLMDDKTCLYMSGRDDKFFASSLRARGGEERDVTLELDKMLFVKPGARIDCPDALIWLYKGAWQKGADEYREWARTWRAPADPKPWAKAMNGYYLVINKQQFGDEIWPYGDIPKLYELGRDYGCDVLGLFGWYDSGHDNKYPELEVSESMGGEDKLKAGIRAVQDAGGHVTLYYQGHLIDVGTEYYKTIGHKLEGKSRWGTPYYEQYSKFSESDFLRIFSRKIFSTVCPWCKPWHELMAERADWVKSFGADGILYDQIGGINPSPCFDESHGHDNPGLSYSTGRQALMRVIRDRVDTHENYGFLTETITDVYSQFVDVIHGIGSTLGAPAERKAMFDPSAAPADITFPEAFRHTFPGNISTIRNPRPYILPRFANYAMAFGFRFEIELRYQKDREAVERGLNDEWRVYANKLFKLRARNADTLLRGEYSCEQALNNANPGMIVGTFTGNGKRAWVVWNDTDQAQAVNMPGARVARWEDADGAGEGMPGRIAANSLIVLFEGE